MRKFKSLSVLLVLFTFLISCTQEEYVPLGAYENGFFVVNEGPFMNGVGSLTFISKDFNTVEQNIYQFVNNQALGNLAQSMTAVGDKAYIIMNGSNTIEVVDRYTMENITTIDGAAINNPRFMVAVGDKAYVSNWGSAVDPTDDFIAVFDLNSNSAINTIPVGEGPEKMLVDDNKILVNLKGGWGQNNEVVVINTDTDVVSSTIDVGFVPTSLLKDASGAIWVLCAGKPSYSGSETAGQLVKIENNAVSTTISFETTEHPEHLSIDNEQLYYALNGKVYSRDINSITTENEMIGFDGYYYGMSAKDGKLYCLDAADFSSEGTLKVFDLDTNLEIQSITTGIIPNAVVFN